MTNTTTWKRLHRAEYHFQCKSHVALRFHSYQFNIAPRYQWFYDRYFMSAELPNSTAADRGVNRSTSKEFDWSLNNTLTWDKTLRQASFHRDIGAGGRGNRYWSDNIYGNITPTDVLGFHYISVPTRAK